MALVSVWVLTGLSGCSTESTRHTGNMGTVYTSGAVADEYDELLKLAQQAPMNRKASLLLDAAELALTTGDWEAAQAALSRINYTLLTTSEASQLQALSERIADESGGADPAEEVLLSLSDAEFERLPPPLKARVIDLRANQMMSRNAWFEAARYRYDHQGLFVGDEFVGNQSGIWNALGQISPSELELHRRSTEEPDLAQWIELALAFRKQAPDLDGQIQAWNGWRANYPNHPASIDPPLELAMLTRLRAMQPGRVAVMLPARGKIANAAAMIRDGIIAGYMQDTNRRGESSITFIDSSSEEDIRELYASLQSGGYDLVIGPLDKTQVEDLALLPRHDPPVLALNYTNNQAPADSSFFQYGLSFDDEINRILGLLAATGRNRILVLTTGAAWATSLLDHLRVEADRLGMTLTGVERTDSQRDLSEGLAHQLGIHQSKQRARELQNLVGKLEFDPRARADIDAVLILTTPDYARQIKPLMAFHYARDIPVFGISQINPGVENRLENSDLNGIYFTETPWMLQRSSELKRQAAKHIPPAWQRLFAMGLDAWHLGMRLKYLDQFHGTSLQGQTGILSIDTNNEVRRTPDWARFMGGVAVATQPVLDEAAELEEGSR